MCERVRLKKSWDVGVFGMYTELSCEGNGGLFIVIDIWSLCQCMLITVDGWEGKEEWVE